uniref:RAB5 interacting factor n=1 Tax=Pelusios castaneus TaxID=367368 RepID=A0A8C8SIK0_9SAUR
MSGARRKEEPPPHAQQPLVANGGGALRGSLWGRALRSDSAWEDKDEFLDVIYWFRQIIAVILGVIWGVVPLKGFVGIAITTWKAGVLSVSVTELQSFPTLILSSQTTLLAGSALLEGKFSLPRVSQS